MKKILIGMPSLDGNMPIEMVSAILSVEWSGKDFQVGYAFVKRAMIHLARNSILRSAIEWDYDYVLFRDNDNPPESPDFLKILFEDIEKSDWTMDIVSGVYWMRQNNKSTVFDEYIEEGGFVNYINTVSMDLSKGVVQEVGNIPTGCVLMKIEVVRKMLEKYSNDPFECRNVTYVKHMWEREEFDIKKIWEYNDKNDNLEYSVMQRWEDLLFFERCKKLWYKLYVDTRVLMWHLSDPNNVKVPKDFFIDNTDPSWLS